MLKLKSFDQEKHIFFKLSQMQKCTREISNGPHFRVTFTSIIIYFLVVVTFVQIAPIATLTKYVFVVFTLLWVTCCPGRFAMLWTFKTFDRINSAIDADCCFLWVICNSDMHFLFQQRYKTFTSCPAIFINHYIMIFFCNWDLQSEDFPNFDFAGIKRTRKLKLNNLKCTNNIFDIGLDHCGV